MEKLERKMDEMMHEMMHRLEAKLEGLRVLLTRGFSLMILGFGLLGFLIVFKGILF